MNNVSGGSKNFEGGGAEDNVSAPSSFIINAHIELYAFYTRKGSFKKVEPVGEAAPTAPLNPPLNTVTNLWKLVLKSVTPDGDLKT